MPFTVAHAVVAPPLAKLAGGRLPASALAVGAMSPDFAYLFFLDTNQNFGHRPAGVVLFCLPLSVVALALWHRFVKRPLASLLPDRWAHLGLALRRPAPSPTWRVAAATVAAVLAGAATHLVSDSFTHSDGEAVEAFSVLRDEVAGHRLYVWLQYGGGVAGVLVLGVLALLWARRQPRVAVERRPAARRVAGAAAIVLVTLLGTLANVAHVGAAEGQFGIKQIAVAAALGAMAGGAVAVTAYGLLRAGRGGPDPMAD